MGWNVMSIAFCPHLTGQKASRADVRAFGSAPSIVSNDLLWDAEQSSDFPEWYLIVWAALSLAESRSRVLLASFNLMNHRERKNSFLHNDLRFVKGSTTFCCFLRLIGLGSVGGCVMGAFWFLAISDKSLTLWAFRIKLLRWPYVRINPDKLSHFDWDRYHSQLFNENDFHKFLE